MNRIYESQKIFLSTTFKMIPMSKPESKSSFFNPQRLKQSKQNCDGCQAELSGPSSHAGVFKMGISSPRLPSTKTSSLTESDVTPCPCAACPYTACQWTTVAALQS